MFIVFHLFLIFNLIPDVLPESFSSKHRSSTHNEYVVTNITFVMDDTPTTETFFSYMFTFTSGTSTH